MKSVVTKKKKELNLNDDIYNPIGRVVREFYWQEKDFKLTKLVAQLKLLKEEIPDKRRKQGIVSSC